MVRPAIIFGLLCFSFNNASQAFANPSTNPPITAEAKEGLDPAPSQANWVSSSHLGFALQDSSSTGFSKTAGSLVFLDLVRQTPLHESLQAGIRSTAQGGQRGEEFYRLSTGPLLTYSPATNWYTHLSYQWFKETGLYTNGKKAYRSQGQAIQFAWERRTHLAERVQIGYGSFFILHQGSFQLETIAGMTATERFSGISSNRGSSHGIELSLTVTL